jgi:hypothetical protein
VIGIANNDVVEGFDLETLTGSNEVVMKCLAREPDKRYPFMSVLVRDLESALYV